MGEKQDLINRILADKKLQNSSQKIYSDEPLIFTASQMKNYTPPEYLEMKKLVNSSDSVYLPATQIFYKQARFMENFRDSFDYHGEFLHYFPTYRDMNTFQLRGYFSWRSDVRDGNIRKTSLSFVFVYIYELINLIGVSSAEDAFFKLKAFAQAYDEIDSRINFYINLWLKDLAVYYGLDVSLLSEHPDFRLDNALITLMNYKTTDASAVLEALDKFSSYKIKNSAFYKKYPSDTENTVYKVFDILSEHYRKTGKSDIFGRLFGKNYKAEYFMFRSAVFCEQKKHADCIYEINSVCRYTCKNNMWVCEHFFCQKDKAGKLGALLKNTDFYLRKSFGFKSSLKSVESTDVFLKAIEKAIALYKEEKQRNARPKIEIDVSKLQNIRDVSVLTRDKLIVDEPDEDDDKLPENEPTAAEPQPETDSPCLLTPVQLEVIKKLLKGESAGQTARQSGFMLSIVTDGINDALFDTFGDTVIAYEQDMPYIIEDYSDELKGMFLS